MGNRFERARQAKAVSSGAGGPPQTQAITSVLPLCQQLMTRYLHHLTFSHLTRGGSQQSAVGKPHPKSIKSVCVFHCWRQSWFQRGRRIARALFWKWESSYSHPASSYQLPTFTCLYLDDWCCHTATRLFSILGGYLMCWGLPVVGYLVTSSDSILFAFFFSSRPSPAPQGSIRRFCCGWASHSVAGPFSLCVRPQQKRKRAAWAGLAGLLGVWSHSVGS